MTRWFTFTVLLALFACAPFTTAERERNERLNTEFQAALADYDAGRYTQAAAELEGLLRDLPDSFDVHELLGMVYSAEHLDAKANEHLASAVRLKPDSAAARTNLATNLVRLGKLGPAEEHFREAITLEPRSFDANHNLGEFYVQAGKLAQAAPLLEQAQRINSSSYDNGYDLALAYIQLGRSGDARQLVRGLLKRKNTAELHNMLAQIEERDGNFIVAAKEFETAAHMEPTESNLFDWASELLLHQTLDPAVDVFQHASERYPDSPRLAIGLGMAFYSRGNYDEAVTSLLRAADLNPSDPRCYYFLSKAYDSSPNQAQDVIERFRRFTALQPQNARAFYYYAMSLWKGSRARDASLDISQIESLLKKSVSLDPAFADAHLQLGNLYSDESKYAESIPEYLLAIKQNGNLADARYRLGHAYVRTGRKDLAQEQLQIYQRLRAQRLAELDKQRAEIRQFVYSAKDNAPTKP